MPQGIPYQNKDILFKVLSETYKEKSFAVYGIDLPPIRELLPTNLPKVSASEKVMDNLFLLEDGTYIIVDYESVYKKKNKIKYLNYIAQVMEKYYQEGENFRLRLIIIYTGDVETAESVLETDCFLLRTEQAFLSNIDGIKELDSIREKLEQQEPITDDDIMKLIILPLTQTGQESKQEMLKKVVELSKELPDEKLQLMALTGVLVASDKFVDDEYSEMVRRFLSMTKIEKIFEKEKLEYANQKTREMALKLLKRNIDLVDIMEVTGLTESEILSLPDKKISV